MRALCCGQTPIIVLLDEHMGVAAMCRERRCTEAPAHLSATGYYSGRLIEADATVQAFNGFKLKLTGANCIEQHGLGNLRSAHHIDQQEIAGQDSIQGFDTALEQSGEETALSREWPGIIVRS